MTLCVLVHPSAGAAPAAGGALEAGRALAESKVAGGLVVHLGATDGQLEADLARTGNLLVHGLATDPAGVAGAREMLREKGAYGLATIEAIADPRVLPYADNLVNLFIADLDELKQAAPPQAEILRALAPRGVAYLKQNGEWSATIKPLPSTMDEWRHWDRNADGNPVSTDTAVDLANTVRWHAGPSKSRNSDSEAGFRLSDGLVVYKTEGQDIAGTKYEDAGHELVCRDAHNGVVRWRLAVDPSPMVPYRHELVFEDGRIYTRLMEGEPMVALNAQTGKTLVTFDRGRG